MIVELTGTTRNPCNVEHLTQYTYKTLNNELPFSEQSAITPKFWEVTSDLCADIGAPKL